MNKERVKGTVDEIVGTVRRMVGESTGDLRGDVSGTVQQLKGEAEIAEGKVKDALKDAHDHLLASNEQGKPDERKIELEENHILL